MIVLSVLDFIQHEASFKDYLDCVFFSFQFNSYCFLLFISIETSGHRELQEG